jgi:hypothetical protein
MPCLTHANKREPTATQERGSGFFVTAPSLCTVFVQRGNQSANFATQ